MAVCAHDGRRWLGIDVVVGAAPYDTLRRRATARGCPCDDVFLVLLRVARTDARAGLPMPSPPAWLARVGGTLHADARLPLTLCERVRTLARSLL